MTRNKPSDQRSEIQQSDLLRAITVPKVMALKKIVDQRGLEDSQINTLGRMFKIPSLAIIIGRRTQQRPVRDNRVVDQNLQSFRDAFKYPVQWEKKKEGYTTVCQKRDERREKLFAMGIAGTNKRRSPGVGGSYRRTQESKITCRKARR